MPSNKFNKVNANENQIKCSIPCVFISPFFDSQDLNLKGGKYEFKKSHN